MDVETHNFQKPSIKQWLNAMRLRTLPLALASTITGAFMACEHGFFQISVFVMTAITTILLQVNSNLANDYGDYQHGTDNEERIGPMRALQSGAINPKQMQRAIAICSVMSLISGSILLWIAPLDNWSRVIFFLLGCLAIIASIKYTAGSSPYGYRGLGDISVVVFFGFLGVVGSYYMQSAAWNSWVLLPAISIGTLSAGVLNINNMRDALTDAKTGKRTIAVRLGSKGSKNYQAVLVAVALDAMLIYAWVEFESMVSWLFLLVYPLILINTFNVYQVTNPADYDKYLKPLALGTFLLSILLAIGLVIENLY